MSGGLRMARLGDIATVGAGNPAPQAARLFEGGTYPFFRTSDVGRIRFGHIHEAADKLNDEGIKGLRRYPKGTILFPKSGASTFLNHRVMLGVDGFVASHLATIVADQSRVVPQFLLYFLATISAQDMIQDHAYPSLNLPTIGGIGVSLPPLAEQQRIADTLDAAFDDLAKVKQRCETNMRNSRALFESMLQSVLTRRGQGWTEKRLADVAREFGRGKSKHRPRNDPRLYGGRYPFIQTGDISQADHWLTKHTQTYSDLGFSQSRLWPRGTVCIAIVGATVGESAILEFDACFPDSVIGVVVDDRVADTEYVEFMLQAFKGVLKEHGKGTARDNINLGTFRNQRFPFPPLAEQKQWAGRLNEFREGTGQLGQYYVRKRDAIEGLRQSLLRYALNGRLGRVS